MGRTRRKMAPEKRRRDVVALDEIELMRRR